MQKKARQAASAAEDKIEDAQRVAVRGVRQAGEEVKDGITEDLPDLIEDAAKELAEKASEEAAEKALNAALDMVELLAPDEITVTLGMELALVVQGEVTVQVTVPNPVAKTTEIRKWANKPPKGRAKIIECVGDFAPSSVSAEFKVSGNGVSGSWSTGDKLEKLDKFLAKHGVD